MVNKTLSRISDKISKNITKKSKEKFSEPKSILKKSKSELIIPDKKVESIWADPQRFFKGEMEEAKNAMFFK